MSSSRVERRLGGRACSRSPTLLHVWPQCNALRGGTFIRRASQQGSVTRTIKRRCADTFVSQRPQRAMTSQFCRYPAVLLEAPYQGLRTNVLHPKSYGVTPDNAPTCR
jgi:hypothetical protein